jgi:hypothetical protein
LAPLFSLSAGNFGVQSFHAMRPKHSVTIEPLVKLGERLWAQAVDPELGFLAHLDETGVTEDPKVARGAGTGDWQQCCELAGSRRTAAEGI